MSWDVEARDPHASLLFALLAWVSEADITARRPLHDAMESEENMVTLQVLLRNDNA